MTIAAGDKVLIEFSTFGDRILSIVTDVLKGGRLLVYSPVPPVILTRMETDPTAMVRFACEGRLTGFRTRVLNVSAGPGTIFELAAPEELHDAEERNEPRCPCRFPALIEVDGQPIQAVVEDMSVSCSRVRIVNGGPDSPSELVGRDVRLTFHPFDMCEGYSVNCAVRSGFVRDEAAYLIVSYKPEEVEARHRIELFVEAQLHCGAPRL